MDTDVDDDLADEEALLEDGSQSARSSEVRRPELVVRLKADPPPLPPPPPARTLREIFRLVTNDPRFGLAAVGIVHS